MELIGNTFSFPWEVELMSWLQNSLPESVISALSKLSFFGEEIFLVAVLGFIYWSYDKQAGRRLGISLLMINVWAPMIKNVALRRRPYMDHEQITLKRLVEKGADPMDISAQGYSFPSQHSANAAGLLASLSMVFKKKWLGVIAVLLPLLVGVSRVAVGAHYPTDVMFGWIFGVLVSVVVQALDRKIPDRRIFYGLLLLTALPGLFFCRSADYFTGLGLLIGFVAGVAVDDKYVRFENTKSPVRRVLRVLGGAAVFLALSSLLKLPFSKDFLSGGTFPALLVRCARYAISCFVAFAIYPMVFKYTAKIGKSA